MSEEKTAIRFYFDYISSNAYIAWTQLLPMAEKYGRPIEPIPVLFAGLLKAHGQLGPAEIPAKSLWMLKNTLRKAHDLGIPLLPPASHPFNPLLALRVSSLPMPDKARIKLVDAMLRATWGESVNISDASEVAATLTGIGFDGTGLVAATQGEDAKARVRQQTDDAIGAGVFGVPTMLVDGELFWGYDDFPYLETLLRGADSLDLDALMTWSDVRPSAVRRRS